MFPFGTQYHRPPTPKSEKWEPDFQLMQKKGFNIARGWAMWGWLNYKEGVYDFSELEYLCDLGLKYDIKIILLVNLESSPAWLYKKHPETLYVGRNNNRVIPHTVHNTCCGGFPGHCFDWPVIKTHAVAFIENLVKHFTGHPALYGWEPHNEPLYEPARYEHEIYCYCPKTIEIFTKWLQVKYGTIEALNNAWQRRFGSFDEVFPPIERGSYADWVDWRIFAIESLVEQDAWRCEVIRQNDLNHPVLMHTRAGSSGRNIACDCTDDWRLSKLADKFGFANFPQGHTLIDHALAGTICRSAAQGKEYWMHELQSGGYGIGFNIPDNDKLSGDRIATWAWTSIVQGAKGLLFWQFRPEQFGAEYGFNLVNFDGTQHERLETAAKIGKCVRDNEQLFQEMTTRPAEIALAFSPMSPLINYLADGTTKPYYESYLGINRLLAHLSHSVDIIRADVQVVDDDFNRYKVIYVPMPVWLDADTAVKLTNFVGNGGILIAEPSLGIIDVDFFSSNVVPGVGLNELFGCHRELISNRQNNTVAVKIAGHKLVSRFFQEELIPDDGGVEVIGTYENNIPAVTMKRYGKGKAFYFGTNIFMEYYHNPQVSTRKVFEDLFHKDVTRFAITSAEEETFVTVAQYKDKQLVCLFNMTDNIIETCLTINTKVSEAQDLYNGGKVRFDTDGNKSHADLQLKAYDSRILLMD